MPCSPTKLTKLHNSAEIPTPAHLDDVHAAAWPVAGITAGGTVHAYSHHVAMLIAFSCTDDKK
jgi:NADPH:quinone reductase-like Zn-dependent oxidoreductase